MAKAQRDRIILAWISTQNEVQRVIGTQYPRPQETWLESLFRLLPAIPADMHATIEAEWQTFLGALATNDFTGYTNADANRAENASAWAIDQLRTTYP